MTNTQNIQDNIPTIAIEELPTMIRECVENDIAVFVHGQPGIGKTQVIEQTARDMGIGCRVTTPALKQQVDFLGVPVADMENKRTVWLTPDDLPYAERDGVRGLYFLDEMNVAMPSIQACCLSLVQERRVGSHELLKGWVPIGAGNRLVDRAFAQRMPTALRNRFAHFEVKATIKGWVKWASAAGINPYLIAFLQFRQNLLVTMPDGDQNAFATPRTWAMCNPFISKPMALRFALVSSLVGSQNAGELEAFLRTIGELPTFEEVVLGPSLARLPSSAGGKYAAAAMIAESVDRRTFANARTYLKRLGREHETFSVVQACRRDESLKKTAAYVAWANENQDVTL